MPSLQESCYLMFETSFGVDEYSRPPLIPGSGNSSTVRDTLTASTGFGYSNSALNMHILKGFAGLAELVFLISCKIE